MGSAIDNLIDSKGDLIWKGRIYGHYENGKIMFNGWKSGENELQIQRDRIQECSIKDDYLVITVENEKTYLYEGRKTDAEPPKLLTPRRGLPVNDLLKFINDVAPEFKDYVYTDVLRQNEKFIDMSFFGEGNEDKESMDDENGIGITKFRAWVEDASFYRYTIEDNGYFKPINGGPITPSEKLARDVLKLLANNNKRNFFIERIEKFISRCEFEKINGNGPICLLEHTEYDLFDRVGMDAPELTDEYERRTYVRGVFRWILCQAITLQFNPEAKIDLAVVIQGHQDCGKSSLCKGLFKGFFTDAPRLDSEKDFVESTTGIVGMEIQEILKRLARKDNRLLKTLISMHNPNLRVAYGRSAKARHIQCVMIFTTNDPQPLGDLTGERRFAPLHKNRTEFTEDPKKIADDDYLGYWALMYKEMKEKGTTPTMIYENEIKPFRDKIISNFEDDPIRHMYLEEVLEQYPNIGDKVPIIVIKDGLRNANGEEICFGLKKYKDDGFLSDMDLERTIDDLKTAPERWGFKAYKNNLSMNTSFTIRNVRVIKRGWLVREKPIELDVQQIFQ